MRRRDLSFLLGLPAIALAGLKEMWELDKIHLDGHGCSVLAAWLDRRIDFRVFRHLGAHADSRTIFDLAIRRLSIYTWRCHPRWRCDGMARVTSPIGRYRCKSLFALGIKNSAGCRRGFRVNM